MLIDGLYVAPFSETAFAVGYTEGESLFECDHRPVSKMQTLSIHPVRAILDGEMYPEYKDALSKLIGLHINNLPIR